jgi:hypothetical protein
VSGAAIASEYTQLALHVLAHVPWSGPGRLDDGAYVAWSKGALPVEAREPIEHDAALIAGLHAREPSDAVHALPDLHRDVDELRATAAKELDALLDEDVADPALLAALRRTPVVTELLRAAMALSATAFVDAFRSQLRARCERGLAMLAPHLEEARALHPALRHARVELAWPLGAHGRAYRDRIVVGVPDGFAPLAPTMPAVLAMHEAAVRAHERDAPPGERYVRSEWAALVDVAERMEHASSALRDAHAAWLASLFLDGLLERARTLGLVDAARAARIASDRTERARWLRA